MWFFNESLSIPKKAFPFWNSYCIDFFLKRVTEVSLSSQIFIFYGIMLEDILSGIMQNLPLNHPMAE